MSDKPKTTLYHSAAVGMSPIQCKVTGDPLESQYPNRKTGIKPFWVELTIEGVKRQYICETDGCRQALVGLKGKNVMLEFTGSRDDASIRVLGAGQAQSQPQGREADPGQDPNEPPDFRNQQPRERTPAPRQEPVADAPKLDIQRVVHFVAQQRNLRVICLHSAVSALKEVADAHPEIERHVFFTPENVREISTSLLIPAERAGMAEWLPKGPMEPKKKDGAK